MIVSSVGREGPGISFPIFHAVLASIPQSPTNDTAIGNAVPRHHSYGNRMVANTNQDLRVPYKRSPGIDYKIIPCIDCPAGIGEVCVGPTGKTLGKGHIARIRLAIRKQAEVEAESVSADE